MCHIPEEIFFYGNQYKNSLYLSMFHTAVFWTVISRGIADDIDVSVEIPTEIQYFQT